MDSYLVGFIASDGHNAKSNWSITQAINGIDVFEKIHSRYKYTYKEVPISDWGKLRKFTMTCKNKYHCKYLVTWGIPSGNKTYTLTFPLNKPDDEIWHYLRGMFDGDGTFGTHNNRYGRVQIISNITWCVGCVEFLSKHNIHAFICDDKRHPGISVMSIKRIESIYLFFTNLYKKCYIYMDRKYNKWIEFKMMREYLEYNRGLISRQMIHLEQVSKFQSNNWKPCLHDQCPSCHGTGIRIDGTWCVHGLHCDCPKCIPTC